MFRKLLLAAWAAGVSSTVNSVAFARSRALVTNASCKLAAAQAASAATAAPFELATCTHSTHGNIWL